MSSLYIYTKLEICIQKQHNFSVCLWKNSALVSFFSYLLWANLKNIFFSHKVHWGLFLLRFMKIKGLCWKTWRFWLFFLSIFYFICYHIIWMAHSPTQSFFNFLLCVGQRKYRPHFYGAWGLAEYKAIIHIIHSNYNPNMYMCSIDLVVSDTLLLHGLWPTKLLCPRDSPGKNTGVGCHSFFQVIFSTQGMNLCLLYCRWILYLWATREAQYSKYESM